MDKRIIKEKYDQLGGELYNLRYGEEQLAKYQKILSYTEIRPDSLILDSGCGTGLLCEMLDGFTVGLDISQELLRNAVNRIGAKKHLIQGDAEFLPLRSDIFDHVFSLTVIQNLDDPTRNLDEINRVKNYSSCLYISILKKASDKDSFLGMIKQIGFKEIKFLDCDSIKDWIALIITD